MNQQIQKNYLKLVFFFATQISLIHYIGSDVGL